MALETPAWLKQHDGALKLGSDQRTWFVLLGPQPQYSLVPIPVKGKFGCTVKQTNNGRQLESAGTYSSAEEALRGGLEDLRGALGW